MTVRSLSGLRACLVTAALLSLGVTSLRATAQGPRLRRLKAHGVMVAFKPEASQGARLSVLRRFGLENDFHFLHPRLARLIARAGTPAADADPTAIANALQHDPAVRVAEPDYEIHADAISDDPLSDQLWGLHNTGQTGGLAGVDIHAPEAWARTTGSSSVIVAVVDTGVDYDHPDLAENILRDGNGAVIGYDFVNNDADPMDDNHHGTHVAGTIGAVGNNALGVIGVSPNVKIMPVKFLAADGSGQTSNAIKCIDFAVANGASIINASWGGGGFSQLLLESIQRARDAGVLFVAAAGNDASNNDLTPSYPASYSSASDNIVQVAATDSSDNLASFSNYGSTVDIAAPGVQILSTTPGNTYSTFNGTSMATPHVSGAAALVRAAYPGISVAQLKARLLYNVERPAQLAGRVLTGRLNVQQALEDDAILPGAPISFRATHRSSSALLLAWTASGDDDTMGAANAFELRYSTDPINDANFNAATLAAGLPTPGAAGTGQSYLLGGLTAGTQYYLALRAVDNGGNVSPVAALGPIGTLASSTTVTALSDNADGTLLFSGPSPWAASTEKYNSASRAYSDSPGTLYRNGTNSSLTQNAGVQLSGFAPSLTFKARTDLEQGYDFVYIEASTDGGVTWQRLPLSLTGLVTSFTARKVSLAQFYGQNLLVRFHIVADDVFANDGIWIDDIQIGGEALEPIVAGVAPTAPAELTAAEGDARVQLSWGTSTGATSYKVKRASNSAGPYSVIASVGTPNYTDAAALNGTTYYYCVVACNESGDSSDSNVAVATPQAPLAPLAPTNLAVYHENRGLRLYWSQSRSTAVVQNRVYRSSSSDGGYQRIATISANTTYLDKTVYNATHYYYYVTEVNSAGKESPASNVDDGTMSIIKIRWR